MIKTRFKFKLGWEDLIKNIKHHSKIDINNKNEGKVHNLQNHR